MRFYRKPKTEPDAETIGVCVLALAAGVGALWLKVLNLRTPKGLLCGSTPIPCPFCGGTRTVSALLDGQVVLALVLNPLVTILLAVTGVWFLYASATVLFRLPRVRVRDVSRAEAMALRAGVVLVLALNWAYIWQQGI